MKTTFISLCMAIVLAASPLPAETFRDTGASDVAERGRQFLVDLLDPSMNLLPEFRGSTVYWLYHDNYLASKVLRKSHPEVAQKIAKAMDGIGVKESGKIEIVFGEASRPLPFRHFQLREVKRIGGKVVKTEVVTDNEMGGWKEYADLLFLAAIAEKEPTTARQHFLHGIATWDGKGFNDRAAQASGIYATYKLALALVAADRLSEHLDAQAAILERLLAQQAKDGGWITDYDKTGKLVGVANVETTSLAILAVEAASTAKRPEDHVGTTTYPTALGNLGVTLAADKPEIMLGEPVYLSFTVQNHSTTDLQTIQGGDYRNQFGRPESYSVTVVDANGQKLPLVDAGPTMGGMMGPQKIPAKGTWVRRLFLPHWAKLTAVGDYTITCKTVLKLGRHTPGKWDHQDKTTDSGRSDDPSEGHALGQEETGGTDRDAGKDDVWQ